MKLIIALLSFSALPSLASIKKEVLTFSKSYNYNSLLFEVAAESNCDFRNHGDNYIKSYWRMKKERNSASYYEDLTALERRLLAPKSSSSSANTITYTTSTLNDLVEQRILTSQYGVIKSELDSKGICRISNILMVEGEEVNVHRIHVTMKKPGLFSLPKPDAIEISGSYPPSKKAYRKCFVVTKGAKCTINYKLPH
jgi:hypothetical protein